MPSNVEDLLSASREALRRGDSEAIADLYHPNAALPIAPGVFARGREQIAEHFARALQEIPLDVDHEPTKDDVHLITPDVAIVDSLGETFRRKPSGEREVLSVEGFTLVAIREGNSWLWAGIRGALVPKAQ